MGRDRMGADDRHENFFERMNVLQADVLDAWNAEDHEAALDELTRFFGENLAYCIHRGDHWKRVAEIWKS